jgi:hypothetical protein
MAAVARICFLTVLTTLAALPLCFAAGYELMAARHAPAHAAKGEAAARTEAVRLLRRAPRPQPPWVYAIDAAWWWKALLRVNLRGTEPPPLIG